MDMSQKRTARRLMRAPQDLLNTVWRLLGMVPALGASVVGASAIGTIAGALYVQSYFDSLHAAWAIDLVPYSVVLRTGLMGGSTLIIALAGTLTMTLTGTLRERGFRCAFWGSIALTMVLLVLRQWSPSWLAGSDSLVDLALLVGMCFSIAFTLTSIIARRIRRSRDRRRVLVAGALTAICLIALPIQRGGNEAEVTLAELPSGLHPDVCVKADAVPWRLIRALDTQMIVARVNKGSRGPIRLVSHSEVVAVLGPGATMTCTEAQPAVMR